MGRGCVSPEEQAADLRKEVTALRELQESLVKQLVIRDKEIASLRKQLRIFMTEDS